MSNQKGRRESNKEEYGIEADEFGIKFTVGEGVLRASNMSLRDYFAGQAMQRMALYRWDNRHHDPAVTHKQVAKEVYRYADAMLEEREHEAKNLADYWYDKRLEEVVRADNAEAENRRLWEALRQIASYKTDYTVGADANVERLCSIADAALPNTEGTDD